MLSHDLRTPLSAISGWLFLLESDKLDAAGKKRALYKIRSNLDEEVKLIDDMLLLARYQARTIRLEMAPVDLQSVIGSAVDAMQSGAAAKKIALHNVGTTGFFVDADPERLKRAFELLLDHALRRISGSEGWVKISVRPGPEADRQVEVVMADNGRGIAPSALPWLFDPFGPPPDPATGSRHGAERALLVAAALIAAHGGQLRVESSGEGSGSTFIILLPRCNPSSGQ